MDALIASFKLPDRKTTLFLFKTSDATERNGTKRASKSSLLAALVIPKERSISKSIKIGVMILNGIDFRKILSREIEKLKVLAFASSWRYKK